LRLLREQENRSMGECVVDQDALTSWMLTSPGLRAVSHAA
jgi:hypothetical protein